jgi:surfactin synthase thioesterase subunit
MTRWLVGRARPTAAVRLYCFPHAGGSPGEYVRWSARLPTVEVWGVQAPGRGSRLIEPAFTGVRELAAALADEVRFAAPFGFFGHSLGALVAYETALALRTAGRPLPGCLVVSACTAPRLLSRRVTADHTDNGEVAGLAATLPAAVRADPELLAPTLATLCADLNAFATYRPASAEPLPCPLIALGGVDDEITEAELSAWRDCTSGPFRLRLLPGGHFYLREERDALLDIIIDDVIGAIGVDGA